MCGITGFVDFTSDTNPLIIRKMTDEIKYRGPDSSGKYIDDQNNLSLGVRRLSIIDLITGDQPISNEDGTVTVVYNGEIYNYQELKKQLEKDKHKFKTNSDTEVLVHLYEKYGERMPQYLNGMFSFAIWDKKNQKLFLARDRAGIKPLYYLRLDKKLIFGSELKTILKFLKLTKQNKPEINLESLSLYCYLGYLPGEFSMFEGIKKLLPGYSISFSKSGFILK